jgi:hypothetical protein
MRELVVSAKLDETRFALFLLLSVLGLARLKRILSRQAGELSYSKQVYSE